MKNLEFWEDEKTKPNKANFSDKAKVIRQKELGILCSCALVLLCSFCKTKPI
jgi:hypothetical protein